MDYKARLTLDTSQHDDAIKKSAKQVNEYDSKVKQTGTDVRKLVAEERKAARERAIANKHYQEMARSVGDFSKGLTGGIGILGKFSGALAIGATAAKVVSDAFMSSETNVDAWGIKVSQAKAAYDVFVTSLNNGNWSNFFTNLREALKGAKELYEKLDDLGSYKASNKAVLAIQRATIADLKRRKANGEKTIDGKDIDDVIKAAEDKLEETRRGAIKRGKEAGKDYMKETLEKYNSALTGVSDSISEQYLKGGYEYLKMQERIRDGFESVMNDTKEITDEFGNVILSTPIFNPDKLSEAFRRQYDIAVAVTEKEDELEKGIAMYADAVDEETNLSKELYGTDKTLNSGTTKLITQQELLKNEMERFQKSIKSARMKMSALKSWSGITNMSEIDVLEEAIRITNEEIDKYRAHLEELKEIQGETATLSEEENEQLKKLIDARKDLEKKLRLERKKWEPARQIRDVGNDSGIQTRAEALNSTYNKYIQSINANELIRVFRNGEIHTNIREDAFSKQDSKRQDQMLSIVNYLKGISSDAQLLINDIEYQSKHLAKVNNGAALYREDINHMKPGEHFTEAHYKYQMERLGARDYDEETRTYNTNTPESEVYGRFVQMAWKACASEQVSKEIISKLSGELTDAFVGSIDDAILRGDYSQIADQLEFAMKAKDFGFSDEQISKMVEHLSDAIEDELNSIHWEGYEIGKGQISNAQNATDTLVGLADAWKNLEETMSSNDTSGWEQFTALVSTIQTTIDSFFQLIDVFRQFGELEKSWDLLNERRIAVTQQQTQANMVQATSEQAKGQAAVESSTQAAVATQTLGATIIATNKAIEASSITEMAAKIVAAYGALPAGPALAAARIAEMLAIYKTASVGSFSQGGIVPKFADGGIFSANRSVGDYNIARVNSGEMILNGSQQSKLFHLLDGTGGFTNNQPSGEVTFRIQGDTLIGVLNNYNKKRSKII